MARRRRRHQRVIRGTARDPLIGKAAEELPVSRSRQPKQRPMRSLDQKISYHVFGRSMRRREAREHGVRLQGAVLDQVQLGIERAPGDVVPLVPGREGGDDQAGVGGSYRRTRSNVSRTCSAVRGGSELCGTATAPLPRFFNRIVVAAISISRRSCAARISRGCPGLRPSASRSAFGTMILPARSMAVFMASRMAVRWHFCNHWLADLVALQRGLIEGEADVDRARLEQWRKGTMPYWYSPAAMAVVGASATGASPA
jgi:hypothetical protein